MSQSAVYASAGFGGAVLRGTRPAVLVIDFTYGFTDPASYPTAADMSAQVEATRRLTDLARAKGFPVIYTVIAYQPGEIAMLPWLRKAGGMATLVDGSRLVEIDARLGRAEGDVIITKKGASAFAGTHLATLLAGAGIDTLIVTGATTSGCVRASVVDAVQCGLNVLVADDCCADRAQEPHNANLYDMQQKYADVTDSGDILQWLGTLG